MKPLVSIIVPVYNVEPYLRQCLDSLVNQTLKELEILVINDGSPDNSQAIIDEFTLKYPKLIKSIIKKNGGVSDTRNLGIKQATGEYIGFVDSDDYVDLTMFEKLYHQAQKTGAEVVVCDYIKDYGNKLQQENNIDDWSLFNNSIGDEPRLLFQVKPYVWNKLIQRDFLLKTELLFSTNQIFEDSAMVYPLLYLANKNAAVEERLYFYRFTRSESIINTIDENIFDIFKTCDIILDFFHKQPDYHHDLAQQVEKQCIYHLFMRINALSYANNRELAQRFIKTLYLYLDNNIPNWKQNEFFSYQHKSWKRMLRILLYKNQFFLTSYFAIPVSIRIKGNALFRKSAHNIQS